MSHSAAIVIKRLQLDETNSIQFHLSLKGIYAHLKKIARVTRIVLKTYYKLNFSSVYDLNKILPVIYHE